MKKEEDGALMDGNSSECVTCCIGMPPTQLRPPRQKTGSWLKRPGGFMRILIQNNTIKEMKRLVLLATLAVMCNGLFAQSKSEMKEQLNALETELMMLKKTDSLNRVVYQTKLNTLEEQLESLTTTLNMQNAALRNYSDQVERQNEEINALSRLVAYDTALRNNPSASSSANVSPRTKTVMVSNANNRLVVPEGKTWFLRYFKSVNYAADGHKLYVSVTGTQVSNYQRDSLDSMVLEEGSEAIFEIRVPRESGSAYSDSHVAPSDEKFFIEIVEYDNEQ